MLKNTKGMTIVEVMAAFAVLLLAAGSFLLCVQAANRQMDKALTTRAQAAALSEALAPGPQADGTEATYVFTYWTLPITVKVQGVEVEYGEEGALAHAFAPAEAEAAP